MGESSFLKKSSRNKALPQTLTKADIKNPKKALQKYQDCLKNRVKITAFLIIIGYAFLFFHLDVVAVLLIIVGLVVFFSKKSWQANVTALKKMLDEPQEISRSTQEAVVLPNHEPVPKAAPVPTREAKTPVLESKQQKPVADVLCTPALKLSENFRVAGTSFHEKEIEEIGTDNLNYEMTKKEIVDAGMEDERIYKLEFFPCSAELIPEPENPYDSKAIMVFVDGVHVGYIKKGSTSRVRNLLEAGGKVSAEIHGGPYKVIYLDDENDKYEIEHGKAPYSVVINITK